ncbi:MAG: hypothetical protein U9R31_03055, partial [Candidatus Omnitrophota bacterium]|nr:hypothetical protein [Candidatus Omnitrophota bacterium]
MLFISAFVLIIGTIAGYLYYINRREETLSRNRSTEIRRGCLELKNKIKKIDNLNIELDYNLLQVSSLYEVTKDMSAALEFSEIFTILSGVIRRTFDFKKSRLILVTETEDPGSIEKIYEIQKGGFVQERIPLAEKRKVTMLERELRARPTEVDIEGFDQNVTRLL